MAANSFRAAAPGSSTTTHKRATEAKQQCLLTQGLHGGHGRLAHALRWDARGADARLAWHHALLLESGPPLLLQLLLNLVDFLRQQVVILSLRGATGGKGGRERS